MQHERDAQQRVVLPRSFLLPKAVPFIALRPLLAPDRVAVLRPVRPHRPASCW